MVSEQVRVGFMDWIVFYKYPESETIHVEHFKSRKQALRFRGSEDGFTGNY